MANPGMTNLTPCALQRLHKDMKELLREPLPGIQVHVHPSNIALMCLLLSPLEGPHHGLTFHLSVSIPPSYPHVPPKVSIETPVHGHPNILGSYICCDILRVRNEYASSQDYMGGYTPAYLLKYIFLQLLTFFSATKIEQDEGGFKRQSRSYGFFTKHFACKECGFDIASLRKATDMELGKSDNGHSVVPKQTDEKSLSKSRVPDSHAEVEDGLYMLHDHVWLIIFDYLSDEDLLNLARASPTIAGDVLHRYNVLLRRELVCFFSRKSFKDAVLGVGVRMPAKDASSLVRSNAPHKKILYIEAFNMLSLEAFEGENVRQGIFGHRFTHFLPLGLDDHHFARAIPALQRFLIDVAASGIMRDTTPTGYLAVIPKLMNTMIVNMMKECDAPVMDAYTINELDEARASKRVMLQASEVAFKGYCLLFHLLVKLSSKFPLIKAKAQEK